MSRIRRLARLYGWIDWHQLDSMGTRGGLPDLILLRPPRVIFAELKSEYGRLTPQQRDAIAMLGRCPGVETYVWRPRDWQTIVQTLGKTKVKAVKHHVDN